MQYSEELVDEVVDLLNDALALDPDAITNLIDSRVECNIGLANHPTIQVNGYSQPGKYLVGPLGLLSAIFPRFNQNGQSYGAIGAIYEVKCPACNKLVDRPVTESCSDCNGKLVLGKLLRFQKTKIHVWEDENAEKGNN